MSHDQSQSNAFGSYARAENAPDWITACIEALAYDPAYYRGVGHALKARIDAALTDGTAATRTIAAGWLAELGDAAQSEIYKNASLDPAMRDAFRKMRRFLMTHRKLTEDEAISLMSVAVD